MCQGQLERGLADMVPPPWLQRPTPSNSLAQPMKPILARRLTGSARINLNNYWTALEGLLVPGRGEHLGATAQHHEVTAQHHEVTAGSEEVTRDNMHNENADNEMRLARMLEVCDVNGSRGNDCCPAKLPADENKPHNL